MDIGRSISQVAFIFLIFVVVSSGYVSDVLSCQMQNMLKNNLYARHIIGVIMIFVFIMLEGGWDYNKERQDKAATDWSSGNTVNTLGYAFGIYALFLISSKSQLVPNLIFFSLVFIIYFVNTYRAYVYERKEISDKTNQQILHIEYGLLSIAALVLIYGFGDYVMYQKKMRGAGFKWVKFFAGVVECDSV